MVVVRARTMKKRKNNKNRDKKNTGKKMKKIEEMGSKSS